MFVSNWYRMYRGKYKIPTFAHREMDIFQVFWAVQQRGGSDRVAKDKQWKVSSSCSDKALHSITFLD